MGQISNGALAVLVIVITFAMCFGIILVVIEDNRVDPIDTFLINEVSITGGLTNEVLNKFEVAAGILGKDPAAFDFSGSTFDPVEFKGVATIRYSYQISANQSSLQSMGVTPVEKIEKEFTVRRTGRD